MDCDTAGDSELTRYEDDCRRGVLPFLRVAALLKHYIYQQDLPEINDESLVSRTSLNMFFDLSLIECTSF